MMIGYTSMGMLHISVFCFLCPFYLDKGKVDYYAGVCRM